MGTGSPPGAPPGVAETHTAVVFFVGDRAYKVKKAVRLPFLDFSTPARRAIACHREVELNRRIAPDVYLGVAEVSAPDRPDVIDDYVVVMRRMPEDRALAELIDRGDVSVPDHVREIARVVAAFHERADRPSLPGAEVVDALRRRWNENIDEMLELRGMVASSIDFGELEAVRALVEEFLTGREELFEQRVEAGFLRDGHGDLQAADIYCLDDGPRILDCIEFDDALRVVDVADDVAFLAMDLERLGAVGASQTLVRWYDEFSGHALPRALVDHYIAYRAGVRAKVAAIRGIQQFENDTVGAREAFDLAAQLLRQCVEHLERAQVRLVLVGGLPGTGKTTLAEAIGELWQWPVLRSDVVRKQQAGLDPTTPAPATYGAGLYAASNTDAVYDELLREADLLLRMGESVIVDASWSSAAQRARARGVASACVARLVELRCDVEPDVARSRMQTRAAGAQDASDATAEIAEQMRRAEDPWPEARRVETARPVADLVRELDPLLVRPSTRMRR